MQITKTHNIHSDYLVLADFNINFWITMNYKLLILQTFVATNRLPSINGPFICPIIDNVGHWMR